MEQDMPFGRMVRERRRSLDLTQEELARRVGCAAITVRKIEAGDLRPSQQIAERLAMALAIPLEERAEFVRQARAVLPGGREPVPTPTPQVAREEIGREDLSGRAIRGYALGERIGTGGFGVVYRAVQPLVEREVAVKIILPEYADHPDFIRRFEAEAQLVARLEHPHIVPLYDYWREPGVAYLVMRLLRGGSVGDMLQHGPLPLETVAHLIDQVGGALHAAHRVGVVHRDLKPANVLLDEDQNAYLADFGIAKNLGNPNLEDQTQVGALVGSPAYMSPEQIRAESIRPQTDIYSLGVMLYELLTGARPFIGPTPIDLIQQHLNAPLPPLAARRPGLPAALDTIITRATAKDPFERYADVTQLVSDFRQVAYGGRLTATVARPMAEAARDIGNPYKGLRAFGEADAADFYGRETLTQQLLARLSEGGDLARFLAVVGPSGSGKSSVVRAGLVPALRRGGLPGSENWFIVDLLPSPHPLEELEAALLRVAINPPESLLAQLREDKRGLVRAIHRTLPADDAIELVLVIDQFEEVFTLVEDETERAHLLDSLVAAVLDERSRIRVVITLRADFIDRPLHYIDFGELLRQRSELVLPLTPDEMERAIAGPAERVGLALEPGLPEAIVADVSDQPGALPLLQYTLTELFEQRDDHTLTKAVYHSIGGVHRALGRRAEEVFASLDEAGQAAARQLFLHLVTLGEGTEDTRRRVLRAELESLDDRRPPTTSGGRSSAVGGQLSAVIDAFGQSRLLSFDRDLQTRGPTVEVAHEALLCEWPRLREWLNDSRADVRMQRLLAREAAEWITANRDTSFLLTGARLEQFEGWALNTTMSLTGDERAYLDASLAERNRRQVEEAERQRRELDLARKSEAAQRTAANRLRYLAGALAIFLLVAIGLTAFAFNQRNNAQDNFITAERTRLASQAQIALDNGEGGDLPALLALRSLKYGYSPEADAALLNALTRGFTRQRYLGHTDAIYDIDLSPDGRYIATASLDATARLWDVQTGQELRRFAPPVRIVNSVEFSPDGRYLMTGSPGTDGARLWDVQTGQEVRQFSGHTGGAWEVKFSPDGQYAVTGDDGVARLWDVQTGEQLRQFVGHTGIGGTLPTFSPDGRYIATGSGDGTTLLWDVATGQELRRFSGDMAVAVNLVTFSPDGQYLLSVSGNIAQLWDIQTGLELRRFVGHTDWVFWGEFSPDSRYILTGSHDKTARLWDVATGQELRQFIGHTGGVFPVTFSPDGRYVLTGSDDRTARLWEVWPKTEPRRISTAFGEGVFAGSGLTALSPDGQYMLSLLAGVEERGKAVTVWNTQTGDPRYLKLETTANLYTISAYAFSPDNGYLLGSGDDGIVWLWDAQTGRKLHELPSHSGPVRSVAFSPDSRFLLTGSDDQIARLWDAQTGEELLQFLGHSGPVRAVAFSADGQFILTGSDDRTARLWEADTSQEARQFLGHTGPVRAVTFSPDGQFVLTGSDDQTARLWEANTGKEVRQFIGHTAQVTQVAFSPDGRTVLTGSADQTARVWDARTGQVVRQFVGHLSAVLYVGFLDDGRYVVTGDTQSAIVWRTTLEEVTAFACAQLTRDLTAEERALYNIADNAPTCAE